MRISELSRRSGVPVATVKYYLREGLLPKGVPTAATQAEYDEAHLRRLRLIRALLEVGGLPLAKIRRVLDAIDDPETGLHELMGTAHYAVAPEVTEPGGPDWQGACEEVDALLAHLGWQVSERAPDRRALARALLTLRRLGAPATTERLEAYATAALIAAEQDLSGAGEGSRENLIEGVLIATVVYENVLMALRRLAQEHVSAQRFGTG